MCGIRKDEGAGINNIRQQGGTRPLSNGEKLRIMQCKQLLPPANSSLLPAWPYFVYGASATSIACLVESREHRPLVAHLLLLHHPRQCAGLPQHAPGHKVVQVDVRGIVALRQYLHNY